MRANHVGRATVTASVVAVLLLGVAISGEWTAGNDRGNRYEGSVRVPVANPDLALLSFTGSFSPFHKEATLKVRFFLPDETAVFISAQELRDRKQYRMEAKPRPWKVGQWNEFAPWPTRDVIDVLGVSSENLGVVVRLGESGQGSGEVAPALVYTTPPPPVVETYRFVFRPGLTLRGLRYTLYRLDGAAPAKLREMELKAQRTRGEPFPIDIDAKDLPPGRIRLLVDAFVKDRSDEVTRQFDFLHKGP
ncbi:MAG: hypothetical protein ACHQNV_08060 [Vicinamibacteria bacterium]